MNTRSTSFGYHVRALLAGTAAIGAAAVATPAMASGVHAGTVIRNIASATFDDGGGSKTINSNPVDLKVDEVLDVTIVARDAGDAAVSAGATGQVRAFTLTNAGNGPEAFSLIAIGAVTGNEFDPTVTAIVMDSNGNGQYDPGIDQAVAANGASPELNPDQSVTVFVVATIPAAAANGKRGEVRLTATSITGSGAPGTVFAGKGSGGGDAVVGATHATAFATSGFVIQSASLGLVKTATIADPWGGTRAVPGSVITYRLAATVAGGGSLANLHITDAIPDGTSYQPGTLALDGAALTDGADSDAGIASSTGIDVTLGNQAAGASHAITFTVKIN